MKNADFAQNLTRMRNQSGYSQYRLGRLLGVSDKAVSKWETGAAQPRMATLSKMASIYGVSLDDLITGRIPDKEASMENNQFDYEESLWAKAKNRLKEIYGDNPPLPFISRLYEEERILRGSGVIEHYSFLADDLPNEISMDQYFGLQDTLTAWLLGTSFINPLPPHTVCPNCKKAVLHPEVESGWDLAPGKCVCGETLIRDGQGIGFDLFKQRYATGRYYIRISCLDSYLPQFTELLERHYGSRWQLCEYTTREVKLLRQIFGDQGRDFALIPKAEKLDYPVENGILQLPESPSAILRHNPFTYLDVTLVTADAQSGVPTDGPADDEQGYTIDEILEPENLKEAFKHARNIKPMIVSDNSGNIIEANETEETAVLNEAIRRMPDIESNWNRETPDFSTLVRLRALKYNSREDLKYITETAEKNRLQLFEMPLTLDDLMKTLIAHTGSRGAADKSIPFRIMSCFSNKKMDGEAQALLDLLDLADWIKNYISWAIANSNLERKADIIAQVCRKLYRVKYEIDHKSIEIPE